MCTGISVPWMNSSWESCWLCQFKSELPGQGLSRRNAANTVRLKQNTNFNPTQQHTLICYNSVSGDTIISSLPGGCSSCVCWRPLHFQAFTSTKSLYGSLCLALCMAILFCSWKSLLCSDQMNDPERKGCADCPLYLHLGVAEHPTYFQIPLWRTWAEETSTSGNVLSSYIILLLIYS